jgi:hypothetical protein
MRANVRIGTVCVLTAGLLVGQMALAGGEKKENGERKRAAADGQGAKQRSEAREQHKQQMHERMEQNREARKQLMEAVAAEEDAYKALELVRAHCVSQHEERSTYHQKMMEERLAKVAERLEGSQMDEAKRTEILSNMKTRMESQKTKAEAHYSELLASLDALKAKDDLVKKDILEALRNAAPERSRKDGDHREKGMRGKRSEDGEGSKQRKRRKNEQNEEKPVA